MSYIKHFVYRKNYDRVVSSIITPAGIRQASILSKDSSINEVSALWDTGATHSVIQPGLARKLNLIPIDKATVCGINSCEVVNVYWIDICLPNNVSFENVAISESDFSGGDILIGMDIIQKGDFVISNAQGKTHFSFRIPSHTQPIYID